MSEVTPPAPEGGSREPAAPARRRWARCLLGCLGLVLLGLFLLGAWIAWLTGSHPPLDPAVLPPGPGARSAAFRLEAVDGIPVMWSNGLPYPTLVESDARPRQDLDGPWELRLDAGDEGRAAGWAGDAGADPAWEAFPVPGTYDAVQGPHPDRDGVVWFRRRFRLEAGLTGEGLARLCFRGVLLRAEVWLNGERLGGHEGGYTPFFLDATPALRAEGENLLVVRADDRLTATSLPPAKRAGTRPGWGAYGGIFRSVYLERLPATHVVKAAATTTLAADGTATVAVEALVREGEVPSALACRLIAPDGRRFSGEGGAGTAAGGLRAHRFTLRVPAPRLWRPADPALHRVELSLAGGERVAFAIGLRTVEVSGEQLLLNGEPIRLQGIAKHEDHPRWGATQPPELLQADLARLDELGVDFVRVSHYPHAVAAMEAMRDRGLLLCEEVPLYQAGLGWLSWLAWSRNPAEFPSERFGLRQLHDPELLRTTQQQMIEMIERDRNNPALILWSIGNECYALGDDARGVFAWLREVVRVFDPSRPTTYSELTFGVPFLDARRVAGEAVEVPGLNMYPGWYWGEGRDAGQLLDAYHARFPGKPLLITECGGGALLGRSEADGIHAGREPPYGRTFSEEYQAGLLEDLFAEGQARPFLCGFCPWVFADFRCPWFPENPLPGYNLKGLLSPERAPKEGFRTLQRLYREGR